MSKQLIAALRRRREHTVEVREGKKVTFLRPAEADMGSLLSGDGEQRTFSVGVEHVRKYVTGWEGWTEADFLGASVGSSDPLPFDAELWAEVCADDMASVNKVATAILDSVVEHIKTRDEAAKN